MDNGGYGANNTSNGYFKSLMKSVALSFIITIMVLMLAAILLCFTDFPEKYTFPSAIAATVLGVLAGSYRAARMNDNNRMFSALTTAFAYAVLAYVAGCLIQGKVMISTNTALFTAIALVTGAIAAILAGRAGKSQKKFKGVGYFTDKYKKSNTKSFKLGKSGN